MECVDFYGIKSDLFLFIFIFRPVFCTFPPKMSAEENQGNVINIWNNDNNSNKTYWPKNILNFSFQRDSKQKHLWIFFQHFPGTFLDVFFPHLKKII